MHPQKLLLQPSYTMPFTLDCTAADLGLLGVAWEDHQVAAVSLEAGNILLRAGGEDFQDYLRCLR